MYYDTYLNADLGEGSAKFSFSYYKEENDPSKMKAVTIIFNHLDVLSLLFRDNEPSLQITQGTVSI